MGLEHTQGYVCYVYVWFVVLQKFGTEQSTVCKHKTVAHSNPMLCTMIRPHTQCLRTYVRRIVVILLHALYTLIPSQTSVKASCTRNESVLQSMAKATEEMVKKKDPKAGHQKKGEALDTQCSKVQCACRSLAV